MDIGAAWWKQKKDRDGNIAKDEAGKEIWILSIQIRVPFLGELNFTLSPNEKKTGNAKPGIPDYVAYWFPPREGGRPAGDVPRCPGGSAPGGDSGGAGFDAGDDPAF